MGRPFDRSPLQPIHAPSLQQVEADEVVKRLHAWLLKAEASRIALLEDLAHQIRTLRLTRLSGIQA